MNFKNLRMSKASTAVLTIAGALLTLIIIVGGALYLKVHHYMQAHPGSDPSLNEVFGRKPSELSAASQEAKSDQISTGEMVKQTEDDELGVKQYMKEVMARAVKEAEARYQVRVQELPAMGIRQIRDSVTGMVITLNGEDSKPSAKSTDREPTPAILKSGGMAAQYQKKTIVTPAARPGVPVLADPEDQFRLCKAEAEAGDVIAQGALAGFYTNGIGTARSGDKALQWSLSAAYNGSYMSQNILSIDYAEGQHGIKRNNVEAYAWAALSAKTYEREAVMREVTHKTMSADMEAMDMDSGREAKKWFDDLTSRLSEQDIADGKVREFELFSIIFNRSRPFVGDAPSTIVPLKPQPSVTIKPVLPVLPNTELSKPAARELAPAGVLYLVVRTQVETDSGIISLPPGTGLKLVRPGVYTDGIREIPLSPDAVTNDVETARSAKRDDTAKQIVIAPRAVTPEPKPKSALRPPAARAVPSDHSSGALGVSGGLDMDRTDKHGHK